MWQRAAHYVGAARAARQGMQYPARSVAPLLLRLCMRYLASKQDIAFAIHGRDLGTIRRALVARYCRPWACVSAVMQRASTAARCRLAHSGGTPRRRCDSAPYHVEHASRTPRHRVCMPVRTLGAAAGLAPAQRRSGVIRRFPWRRRHQRSPDPDGCSESAFGPAVRQDRRLRRLYKLVRNRRMRGCTRRAHPCRQRISREPTEPSVVHKTSQYLIPFAMHIAVLNSGAEPDQRRPQHTHWDSITCTMVLHCVGAPWRVQCDWWPWFT